MNVFAVKLQKKIVFNYIAALRREVCKVVCSRKYNKVFLARTNRGYVNASDINETDRKDYWESWSQISWLDGHDTTRNPTSPRNDESLRIDTSTRDEGQDCCREKKANHDSNLLEHQVTQDAGAKLIWKVLSDAKTSDPALLMLAPLMRPRLYLKSRSQSVSQEQLHSNYQVVCVVEDMLHVSTHQKFQDISVVFHWFNDDGTFTD